MESRILMFRHFSNTVQSINYIRGNQPLKKVESYHQDAQSYQVKRPNKAKNHCKEECGQSNYHCQCSDHGQPKFPQTHYSISTKFSRTKAPYIFYSIILGDSCNLLFPPSGDSFHDKTIQGNDRLIFLFCTCIGSTALSCL